MSERIFIGVAWPYANGSLHLGHIAGAYLPADIFARYHRLKGNEVLMVSGADQHGTPITIKAEAEGRTPGEIAGYYHQEFCRSWEGLGISFDLFTTTGTANHAAVAREMFLTLQKKGHIYKDTVSQPYCPRCRRFLPDRYVSGTCPECGYAGTRGDQCDGCGRPLNTAELREPQCRICGNTPVFRDSEHFFLRLSDFQEELTRWVESQIHWRPNVYGLTMRYLKEGLKDRAITRDIDWGVPVPVEGFEEKRLYVWFEAVIGYLSASREWSESIGKIDEWRLFWQGDCVKSYYFIGKDNISFHTLIWPAMLLGHGALNLPFDVPANEFLTIEGKKLSTSKNWAVWLPDYLARYDPDPLRYLLSINMPETGDTDFSWRELVRRNNEELVSAYGNLVNRVLTFVYRNFNGTVPEHSKYQDIRGYIESLETGADTIESGLLDSSSHKLIKDIKENLFRESASRLEKCNFKQALSGIMAFARQVNQYLDEKAPWKAIKQDQQDAADSLYIVLYAISCLKTVMYPFLPFSSQKIYEYLGFEGRVEDQGWQPQPPPPGQKLREPKPLFVKLDESIIEEETGRIGT